MQVMDLELVGLGIGDHCAFAAVCCLDVIESESLALSERRLGLGHRNLPVRIDGKKFGRSILSWEERLLSIAYAVSPVTEM